MNLSFVWIFNSVKQLKFVRVQSKALDQVPFKGISYTLSQQNILFHSLQNIHEYFVFVYFNLVGYFTNISKY